MVPRCSGCGKKRKSVYDSRVRDWRHLDLAGIKTILRYDLRRVSCKKCGVLVETVPWAESASRYTFPMEGLVAFHAQKTDKTTAATLMRIAWRTVGQIVTRFVHREREEMGDPSRICVVSVSTRSATESTTSTSRRSSMSAQAATRNCKGGILGSGLGGAGS